MTALIRWVFATFILCFLVILAGGIVRTTQSGMGCPDWPRCFGKWIPPTSIADLPADYEKYLRKQDIDHSFNAYHTWVEYINRLLGVLLGVFAIIQFALAYRKRETMRRSFRLSIVFLALVILTGLFGAIVVKLNLAHLSISVHLLFALILLQVQCALLMAVRGKLNSIALPSKLRNLYYGLLVVILIQATMGTMVRMHIDDISRALNYGKRDSWLDDAPWIFMVHRSFSWLVLICSAWIAYKSRAYHAIRKQANYLLLTMVCSMLTGIVLYYLDMPAIAQPVHLLLAAAGITINMTMILRTSNAT